jgi:hypothetical protein
MTVADDNPVTQIGGYDVKGQVHHLGPIVWTPVTREPEGVGHTDFEGAEPKVLPPQMSPDQANVLAVGLVSWLLHDYILPEIERRFGLAITEREVLSTPDYPRCRKALVIVPQDGVAVVRLNEEVEDFSVPADCAYARLTRDGYKWEIQVDWLPVFPVRVQEKVHASVAQLAEAIIKGDEKKATDLARLSFPSLWSDSPKSLQDQMNKEVYVLLFGIGQRLLNGLPSSNNPLEAITAQFPQAVDALRMDYSLEAIKAEAQERSDMSGIRLKEFIADMEQLFGRAGLSNRELRVLRLEAALSVRNEHWSTEDKEIYLHVRQGTYKTALHRGRVKLLEASKRHGNPYKTLLEAIFPRSGGEVH